MKSEFSNDFAMKLIEKELEFESNCDINNLNELVQLYRGAIEYFEEIKDPKFWGFQERLQKILMRPNVLALLSQENDRSKREVKKIHHEKPTSQEKLQKVEKIESKGKTLEKYSDKSPLKVIHTFDRDQTPKTIQRIVENQGNRNKNVSTKAVVDIKSQERGLQERLRSRQKKALNMSSDSGHASFLNNTSFTSPAHKFEKTNTAKNDDLQFCLEFESDASAGYFESINKQEELEKKIEKIIEENFAEKTEKITEIKIRFETQINEFNDMGKMFEVISDDLRVKMEEEIQEISNKLDLKRKKLISLAKKENNL